MGRFYDKGLQTRSAPPGQYLRYEVEYKSAAAVQIAKQTNGLQPGPLSEFIRCTVHQWFLTRWIVPVFEPDTDTPGLEVRSVMKQTTADRKLAWLRSQVRPTIQYLFELGLKAEVLRALDIDLVEAKETVYNHTTGQQSAGKHMQGQLMEVAK